MAHIHEKIDFCADVFIINNDAVLLRMHDKYNRWFPPGGHIELDEDPVEAALREVKEEVGLDVVLVGGEARHFNGRDTDLLVPRFMNRHRISDTHEHVSLVYFAISSTRDVVPGEGESTEGIRWFTAAELDDPQYGIDERVPRYAHAALAELVVH